MFTKSKLGHQEVKCSVANVSESQEKKKIFFCLASYTAYLKGPSLCMENELEITRTFFFFRAWGGRKKVE